MINLNLNLQATTGVYVGPRDVYIAQAKGSLFGVRLVKFARIEIAAAGKDEETAKRQATIRAIKRGLQENNITTKKIVSALTGKDVLIRYFQMPKIPKAEWETAIKFEAKKYIPFKIEDLMWHFQLVLAKGKAATMDVAFVAVKKTVAESHLSLLKEAGLKVQALEPAPFSLVRLLSLSNQLAKDKPIAVVDVDYGLADINIVKNKISYLTRDVTLPLEDELVFESLLNEIRMSLDYYEKLFPAQVVAKIVLCGQGRLEDWAKKLEQELKLPTETADLAKALKIPKVLPPLNMSVACGLALRGVTAVLAEVDLYRLRGVKPEVLAKKEGFEFTPEIKRAMLRALAISCAGLLILQLIMSLRIGRTKRQFEKAASFKSKVSLPIGHLPYSQLEGRQKELENKLSVLSEVIDKRVLWTDKLNELPRAIPPGAWLTNLSFDDRLSKDNKARRSLTIKGVAYHEDPVREVGIVTRFVSNLKANKLFARGFKEIKLEAMTSRELKGMAVKNFTISCK